jgi:hypothetical protein
VSGVADWLIQDSGGQLYERGGVGGTNSAQLNGCRRRGKGGYVRVETFADLAGQRFQGEWLLQDPCGHVNRTGALECGFGITRDEQNFHVRAVGHQLCRQLRSTHLGHDHVSDHQMNGTAVPSRDGQRFGPILWFEDDIAVPAEKLASGLPDCRFIFRQQLRFRSLAG